MTVPRPRAALAALAAASLALTLAGCSATAPTAPATQAQTQTSPTPAAPASTASRGSAALDALVTASQAGLQTIKDNTGGLYSDIKVLGEGSDTLVYEFVFAKAPEKTGFNQQMEAQLSTLQQTVDTAVGPSMKAAGIAAPKVRYTFKAPDGTELWTRVFQPS